MQSHRTRPIAARGSRAFLRMSPLPRPCSAAFRRRSTLLVCWLETFHRCRRVCRLRTAHRSERSVQSTRCAHVALPTLPFLTVAASAALRRGHVEHSSFALGELQGQFKAGDSRGQPGSIKLPMALPNIVLRNASKAQFGTQRTSHHKRDHKSHETK